MPFGPLLLVIAFASLIPEAVVVKLLFVSMAWFLCALILVPALMFRGSRSSPGSPDDRGGDGGGPTDPSSSHPGAGGIPLADAEQSRERIRDHVRPERRWSRRRVAREPRRTPAPKIAE
ncbi:MAG: hypothetical protein ACRDPA_02130 [Solirubrobacteraceae bacterium]